MAAGGSARFPARAGTAVALPATRASATIARPSGPPPRRSPGAERAGQTPPGPDGPGREGAARRPPRTGPHRAPTARATVSNWRCVLPIWFQTFCRVQALTVMP